MTDTRSITLLDASGDTTITWDEDTDEKILPIIEKKMQEGFVFYIVKATPIIKTSRLVKAKSIKEVRAAGKVTIRDEALEELFLLGQIGVTKASPEQDVTPIRKAANANDVVSNQSVGVRPARGG